jgi:hypothetical protein
VIATLADIPEVGTGLAHAAAATLRSERALGCDLASLETDSHFSRQLLSTGLFATFSSISISRLYRTTAHGR